MGGVSVVGPAVRTRTRRAWFAVSARSTVSPADGGIATAWRSAVNGPCRAAVTIDPPAMSAAEGDNVPG